jgi:hypothetical protein
MRLRAGRNYDRLERAEVEAAHALGETLSRVGQGEIFAYGLRSRALNRYCASQH